VGGWTRERSKEGVWGSKKKEGGKEWATEIKKPLSQMWGTWELVEGWRFVEKTDAGLGTGMLPRP